MEHVYKWEYSIYNIISSIPIHWKWPHSVITYFTLIVMNVKKKVLNADDFLINNSYIS